MRWTDGKSECQRTPSKQRAEFKARAFEEGLKINLKKLRKLQREPRGSK